MERVKPEIDDICHIYNRGTDKRIIFDDEEDRFRFIHYLYACNDTRPLEKIREPIKDAPAHDAKREPLVDLLALALMPNHIHLAVHQKVENGISKYVQKTSVAYTMYYNEKNKRSGALFQGKYKYKFVEDERYLAMLIWYIHMNPLELFQHDWKEKGLHNKKAAREFLRSYRWSSFFDYEGIKNFPSLLDLSTLGHFTDKEDVFKDFMSGFTEENLESINHLMLD
ncbi:MAG: hypothetical protein A2542_03485 [Parcubacteria group bacterium RIFOXYD2_FULL_52_8]|nr:MAG: hypothetical protein A2542_03485 [Parcubacteria group bacterium RIFOXYD2_FULL_52_8]